MKQFSLNHNGLHVLVEVDQGALFWYRTRLLINNEVADERGLLWGTTRLRASHPQPVAVDVTAGLLGARKAVLNDEAGPVALIKGR